MSAPGKDELVCAACGSASCWAGDFMCENARTADVVSRWRWESNEAQSRLAWLVASRGKDWAFDGTLLHAVAMVERLVAEDAATLAALDEPYRVQPPASSLRPMR